MEKQLRIEANETVMGDLLPEEEIERIVALAKSVERICDDDTSTVCNYEEQPLPPPVRQKTPTKPKTPIALSIPEGETVLDRYAANGAARKPSPRPARGVEALASIPETRAHDAEKTIEPEEDEEEELMVVPRDLDKSDRDETLGPPTGSIASLEPSFDAMDLTAPPRARPQAGHLMSSDEQMSLSSNSLEDDDLYRGLGEGLDDGRDDNGLADELEALSDPTSERSIPDPSGPVAKNNGKIDELKALSALCGIGMDETVGPASNAPCIDYDDDSFIARAHAEVSALEEHLPEERPRTPRPRNEGAPRSLRPGFHEVAPQRYIRTRVTSDVGATVGTGQHVARPNKRREAEESEDSPRFAHARGPTYLVTSPEPTSRIFAVILFVLFGLALTGAVFFQVH